MSDFQLLSGMEGCCGLCLERQPLQESHFVPAFAFKWLKATSATGHIRFGENPNRRVQDGIKRPLLCAKCEALFNSFETPFATKIFYPILDQPAKRVGYQGWMLKFAASLSWRVLAFAELRRSLAVDSSESENVQKAFLTWSQFLKGERTHPEEFEQHLLPLGLIEDISSPDVPDNINRYFMRAIDTDIAFSHGLSFTYVKLGPFAFFGFLKRPVFRWGGSKISVRFGSIEPRRLTLPLNLQNYLFDRSKNYGEIEYRMSQTQVDKVEQTVLRDIDRVLSSHQFEAMKRDAEMFGEQAIIRKESKRRGD